MSLKQVEFTLISAAVVVGMLNGFASSQTIPCQVGETQKLTWEPILSPTVGSGYRVAVALDDSIAAIGCSKSNSGQAGRAFVFEDQSGAWAVTATLNGSDSQSTDLFAHAVDVSGTTIVVGAPNDDHAGGNDAGSAYVFVKSGAAWVQSVKLTASDAQPTDLFGSAIALEGNTLLIGAPGDDDQGSSAGAVYVFEYDGAQWTQQQKLIPPPSSANHKFGFSLAIDGANAVIGTELVLAPGAGLAYVWTHNGTDWANPQTLIPPDGANGDRFGSAVAIDGDWVVVGSPRHEGGANDSGAAYTYKFDGKAWTFHEKLTQPVYPELNEQFGGSAAIEGDTLLIGCPLDRVYYDHTAVVVPGFEAGSAYQYSIQNDQFAFKHQLRAKEKFDSAFEQTTNHLDHLALTAAISNGTILLGSTDDADGDSCSNNWIGSAMIFSSAPPDCDNNGIADTCDPDCNNNLLADQCDFDSGSSEDCNANSIPDECETAPHYVLDDGTLSLIWGAGNCTSFDWLFMNQFTVTPGREYLTHVSIAWSADAPAFWPAKLLVYGDPNNDGNPIDAQLLASLDVANIDEFNIQTLAPFTTYAIPRTYVGNGGDIFFVGVMTQCPHDTFIATSSSGPGTPSQGRSWSITAPLGEGDIKVIANNNPPNAINADWMIRALALDCNGNGAWDQCDIDSGFSQDTNKDGIPDECQPLCSLADATADGVIDVDDLLTVINNWGACDLPPGECNGDLTGDGLVDVDDLLIVITSWGPCV